MLVTCTKCYSSSILRSVEDGLDPSQTYDEVTVTSHINYIVARPHDKRCLSHSMHLYQVTMTVHFLNDVVNDVESTRNL